MPTSGPRLALLLVLVACLAPVAGAQQLVLPADGQPVFTGSGWNGAGIALVQDLNHDGYLDLLSADEKLVTALNNGHGVFVQVPGKPLLQHPLDEVLSAPPAPTGAPSPPTA